MEGSAYVGVLLPENAAPELERLCCLQGGLVLLLVLQKAGGFLHQEVRRAEAGIGRWLA